MVTMFPAIIVSATKPKAVLRAMDSVFVRGEFSELDISVIYTERDIQEKLRIFPGVDTNVTHKADFSFSAL